MSGNGPGLFAGSVDGSSATQFSSDTEMPLPPAPNLDETPAAAEPTTYTVQSGDSLSKILGTSDPAAIGAFMNANGLSSSTIYPGQQLVLPSGGGYSAADAALGQTTLNTDNARLATLQAAKAPAGDDYVDDGFRFYNDPGVGASYNYGNGLNYPASLSVIDGYSSPEALAYSASVLAHDPNAASEQLNQSMAAIRDLRGSGTLTDSQDLALLGAGVDIYTRLQVGGFAPPTVTAELAQFGVASMAFSGGGAVGPRVGDVPEEMEVLPTTTRTFVANDTSYYPLRLGFSEEPETITLLPGARFDRIGGYFDESGNFRDGGSFAADVGTPFEQRALPYSYEDSQGKPYNIYEVIKPLPGVQYGQATYYYGQIGGGGQYYLPNKIEDLIQAGIIKSVTPPSH